MKNLSLVKLTSLRLTPRLLAPAAFIAAALVSTVIAWGAALVIERVTASAVTSRLLEEGITWAKAEPDGLQIHLTGTAPNEASRYRVINLTGSLIDSSRIRDKLDVTPAKTVEAPHFSVEMLRNDDGIQLIGLLPQGEAKEKLTADAQAMQAETPVQDMLETAAYEAPEGWEPAYDFGVKALALLPRSKISVSTNRVAITAIAASDAEKRRFEADLKAAEPQGVRVSYDISAPRPVITPFTLRFVKDANGARFDACAADTDRAKARILAAAGAAGATGRQSCTVGLGVPSPSWAEAVGAGIKAVNELGLATITFKDADVTLLAAPEVKQADFDRVVGDLDAALPEVFSLDATLEKKASASEGPAEFTATIAAGTGRVELRGRLTTEMQRAAVDSFARALFGSSNVYLAARLDPALPDGWPVRVLAGLQALSELEEGSLLVRADTVEVKGVTGSQTGKARISQVLSDKLGQGKTFRVDVRYDEALDPLAAIPTPEECAEDVADVLARQKISFTPGSAEIDAKAASVMTALSNVLGKCPGVPMEIGGHTDSQGSDEGNRALSQARAEAVLLALQGRQVDVSAMVAKGYGEAAPIADNGSEAGREANRRIEFTLIGGTPAAAAPQAVAPAANGAAPAAGADAATPAATGEGPDFSGDTSPSVAPKDKTRRPEPRPKSNG